MLPNICAFRKTNHFLFRQWDRCINDTLLQEFMRNLPRHYNPKAKYNLVFSRSYCLTLIAKGFEVPKLNKNECIILAIENFRLLTIYKYTSTDDLFVLLKAHRGEIFEII